MIGLASCAGCGKAEPGDDMVEAIVAEVSPAGEAETAAVIARCAAALSARLDAERVAHFAPLLRDRTYSRAVAEHEGAHAVVGIWFGATVESVDIDAVVCCRFVSLDPLLPLQRVLALLAGHAVGQAAQPLDLAFCARVARSGERKGCDRCKAMRGLVGAMPDSSEAEWLSAYRAMEERAARLVRYRPVRDAIVRVANALVERGHLSGAEVEASAGPEIMGAAR